MITIQIESQQEEAEVEKWMESPEKPVCSMTNLTIVRVILISTKVFPSFCPVTDFFKYSTFWNDFIQMSVVDLAVAVSKLHALPHVAQ